MAPRWASLLGLSALLAAPALAAPKATPADLEGVSIHTVFSAECTPYFDWQSLGLVRSHRLVRALAARPAAAPRSRPAGGHARPHHAPAGMRRGGFEEVRVGRGAAGEGAGALAWASAHAAPLLRSYKYVDIVPTHVHPNFNTLHLSDIGDNYVPYNKPGSIKHWCGAARLRGCRSPAQRRGRRGGLRAAAGETLAPPHARSPGWSTRT